MSAILHEDQVFRLIGAAQAAYARCIDDHGAQGWPDFFDTQCLYVVTTADNHRRGLAAGLIYADSQGMLKDRISALNDANIYERHSYRHILGQPAIGTIDSDLVAVETAFLVARIMRTGETTIFASGRYLDVYRVNGEQVLLRERIVVCDSNRIDTLMALPL